MRTARTEYVVHLNRSRLTRRQGFFIGLNAFLVVLFVGLYAWFFSILPEMAGTWFIVFVLVVLGPLFQIVILTWTLGKVSAVSRPMVIGPDGIELHSTDGYLRLSWQAIETVELKAVLMSQQLAVRVHPGAGQDPNVVAEVSPRAWQRIGKHGVLTNTAFIVEPVAEVLQAVAHFSAGRVRVGPQYGSFA